MWIKLSSLPYDFQVELQRMPSLITERSKNVIASILSSIGNQIKGDNDIEQKAAASLVNRCADIWKLLSLWIIWVMPSQMVRLNKYVRTYVVQIESFIHIHRRTRCIETLRCYDTFLISQAASSFLFIIQ